MASVGLRALAISVLPSPQKIGNDAKMKLPQFKALHGSEIRPVLGYSWGLLHALVNPIVDVDLTPGSSATPDFSPAAKLNLDTRAGFALGVEYYSDLSFVNRLESSKVAEQYLFAAYDLLHGPIELNLALGGGLNRNSNPTVAKAIFGFTF